MPKPLLPGTLLAGAALAAQTGQPESCTYTGFIGGVRVSKQA